MVLPPAVAYYHCYCEENCFRLCEQLLTQPAEADADPLAPTLRATLRDPQRNVFVAFISSLRVKTEQEDLYSFEPSRIAICAAPAAEGNAGAPEFVLWDYHVVVMFRVDALSKSEQGSPPAPASAAANAAANAAASAAESARALGGGERAGGAPEWFVVDFDCKWPPTPSTCIRVGDFAKKQEEKEEEEEGTRGQGGSGGERAPLYAWPLKQYLVMTLFPRTVARSLASRYDVQQLEMINRSELRVRLVPAAAYLAALRTDRSHMLTPVSRRTLHLHPPAFQKPPPPSPAIQGPSAILLEGGSVGNDMEGARRKFSSEAARIAANIGDELASSSCLGQRTNLVCFINMSRLLGIGDVVLTREELLGNFF